MLDTSMRSISEVLRDIVQNVQDIMRSEFRLAKTEIGEELSKAKSAGALLAAGACAGFLGIFFTLWAAVFALSTVMPNWAAALTVAIPLGLCGVVMLLSGRKRLRGVKPIPQQTVESMKESVQWAKQQTK